MDTKTMEATKALERGKQYWDRVNIYSSLGGEDDPEFLPAEDEGVFLQARLLHMGLNFTEAAKAMGVTRRAIYNVLWNGDPLTRKMASKLADIDDEFVLVPAWRIMRKKEMPARSSKQGSPAASGLIPPLAKSKKVKQDQNTKINRQSKKPPHQT